MTFAWKRIPKTGLTLKLVALFVAGTAAVLMPAYLYHYTVARRMVFDSVESSAGSLTEATVQHIEAVLNEVEVLPRYVASLLERRDLDRAELEALLTDELAVSEAVYGATAAFEPGAFEPGVEFFAPYVFRRDGRVATGSLGGPDYRYHEMDWYIIPKQLNTPLWSEPYYDKGGGDIMMSTYSVPFYRTVNGERVFAGVLTVDVSLKWLQKLVSDIKVDETGYAFILSRNGLFVAHPSNAYVMQESIFSVAEAWKDPGLRRLGQDMLRGGSRFSPVTQLLGSRKGWIYYAPLPSAQWSLGVVFPEKELFADLHKLFREVLLIGTIGALLWLVMVVALSTTFTRPLRQLSRRTQLLATGNLDVPLPLNRSHDEVGDLSRSFESMRLSLKDYIQNLKVTTAAKERIESELSLAHEIQMSFLQKTFPPFPKQDDFDLYAVLLPAKEVGGDLYDFSLVDDHRLFFCIGDVSDKGVPAALFMSVTQTLIRSAAQQLVAPDRVLSRVNADLCDKNESAMFVTAFAATFDYVSGEMAFANAGHNPPLVVRAGGTVEWLDLPEGLVLGVDGTLGYDVRSIALSPGDKVVVYTDGVTEAMNEARQLFSEQRLFDEVAARVHLEPKEMCEELMAAVKTHAGAAPQSDDITVMVMAYRGIRPAE